MQYKAAKKTCPKPGSAARKQLQSSFVTQLVQQAEFDAAAKKLNVTVKPADVTSNLLKLEAAVREGDERQGRRREVEEGARRQPHDAGDGRREPAQRTRASAIFVNLTKNVKVSDADVQAYYTKNK